MEALRHSEKNVMEQFALMKSSDAPSQADKEADKASDDMVLVHPGHLVDLVHLDYLEAFADSALSGDEHADGVTAKDIECAPDSPKPVSMEVETQWRLVCPLCKVEVDKMFSEHRKNLGDLTYFDHPMDDHRSLGLESSMVLYGSKCMKDVWAPYLE